MLTEKRNRKGTIYFVDETGNIVAKNCTKCNEAKTLNEFTKHKAGLGGRSKVLPIYQLTCFCEQIF